MSARPEARALGAILAVVFAGGALVVGSAIAIAGRPPEVLEQERHEEAVALDYLVRKSDSLSASLVERRGHLRHRLRAMYKMSQGGYVRLLLGAESATDLFARRNAAQRILHRDVAELVAVRDELSELSGLRERLREAEGRAAELLTEAREAEHAGVGEHVKFRKPVPGKIAQPFGPYHDERGLEFTRDGVELECKAGEAVLAPAAGAVRSVTEIPGVGTAVVIDHGDGWISLVGNLRDVKVRLGARVPVGFAIGVAAGKTVHLQLAQSGTWVDPAIFL